jgi:hypothetical protein
MPVKMIVVDGIRYRPEDAPEADAGVRDAEVIDLAPGETVQPVTVALEATAEKHEDPVEPVESTVEKPSKSGSKEAWKAYARSVDPDADVEDLTRDEIAERYA